MQRQCKLIWDFKIIHKHFAVNFECAIMRCRDDCFCVEFKDTIEYWRKGKVIYMWRSRSLLRFILLYPSMNNLHFPCTELRCVRFKLEQSYLNNQGTGTHTVALRHLYVAIVVLPTYNIIFLLVNFQGYLYHKFDVPNFPFGYVNSQLVQCR